MTTDDYAFFARMKKKMSDRNMSVEDLERMFEKIYKNTEENEDEKTIL